MSAWKKGNTMPRIDSAEFIDRLDLITPERVLWAQVIKMAVMDGLGIAPSGGRFIKKHSPEWLAQKEKARGWLTANSLHFRAVCDLAGVDPVEVRNTAIRVFREQDEDGTVPNLRRNMAATKKTKNPYGPNVTGKELIEIHVDPVIEKLLAREASKGIAQSAESGEG
jgi:hypothetical protein